MALTFEASKCIGCRLCELSCTARNENTFTPSLARLRVDSRYEKDDLKVEGKLCTLCLECVDTCPVEAITFKDGRLHYDADECTSCYACVEACPEEVIVEKAEGVGLCQLCEGEPQCVAWCPREAITLQGVQ